MSDIAEIRARLGALAAAIAWPTGEYIVAPGDRLDGPFMADTGIAVGRMGAMVVEGGLDFARGIYGGRVSDEHLRAAEAYYTGNRDRFQALAWRRVFAFGQGRYEDHHLPALQADVRDLLAEVDRRDRAAADLVAVVRAVASWEEGSGRGDLLEALEDYGRALAGEAVTS